jgi:glycopeptide antibiotics resistance protein
LFAPVGFLALLLFRRMTWLHALLLGVAAGVTMEVLEGVLRVGIVDIDDLILNTAGVMCGYGLGRWWQRQRELVRVTSSHAT